VMQDLLQRGSPAVPPSGERSKKGKAIRGKGNKKVAIRTILSRSSRGETIPGRRGQKGLGRSRGHGKLYSKKKTKGLSRQVIGNSVSLGRNPAMRALRSQERLLAELMPVVRQKRNLAYR